MNRNKYYLPNEDWLYYKIYTGYDFAEDLLIDHIFPYLVNNINIKKWFFIRYKDSDYHLRLRIQFEKEALSELLFDFNNIFRNNLYDGLINDISIHIYKPETERYGDNTMTLTESLFHHNSIATVHYLKFIRHHNDENIRWLIGMKLIDFTLESFNYCRKEKLQFVNNIKKIGYDAYSRDVKNINKIANINFAKNLDNIDYYLTKFNLSKVHSSLEILEPLNLQIKKNIKNIFENNKNTIEEADYMNSIIHMNLNRLFKTRNTMNEFMCYYLLSRFYMYKYHIK